MHHDAMYEAPAVLPQCDSAELLEDLPGGRRELRLRIGAFAIDVTEIPGKSITEREWQDVMLARSSYAAMWGGGGSDRVTNDPFDGLGASPYRAWHYLAWVRDGAGPRKLVTMRKVAVLPSELTGAQREHPEPLLPDDLRFWKVETGGGAATSCGPRSRRMPGGWPPTTTRPSSASPRPAGRARSPTASASRCPGSASARGWPSRRSRCWPHTAIPT